MYVFKPKLQRDILAILCPNSGNTRGYSVGLPEGQVLAGSTEQATRAWHCWRWLLNSNSEAVRVYFSGWYPGPRTW